MTTKQEKYAKGLLNMGYREELSPSRKYRLFFRPGSTRILLGKSGAVRHTAGAVSKSFAAAEATKREILANAR